MKTLIVEDDFTCRLLLQEMLKEYGPVHVAVYGKEALDAIRSGLDSQEPYDLVCMDIMMPEMDGQQAVSAIRSMEESRGIIYTDGTKIVLVTALGDMKNVSFAFGRLCDSDLVKPIDKNALLVELRKLELIS